MMRKSCSSKMTGLAVFASLVFCAFAARAQNQAPVLISPRNGDILDNGAAEYGSDCQIRHGGCNEIMRFYSLRLYSRANQIRLALMTRSIPPRK